MKPTIFCFLLIQGFIAFSFPNSTIENHLQTNVRVSCDLINFKPCKFNKMSTAIRINLYEKDSATTDTWLLVASQIIDIPCRGGMSSKTTGPKFNRNTRLEKEKPLMSVVDYLNKNDKDKSIFEKILDEFEKTLKSIDENFILEIPTKKLLQHIL